MLKTGIEPSTHTPVQFLSLGSRSFVVTDKLTSVFSVTKTILLYTQLTGYRTTR